MFQEVGRPAVRCRVIVMTIFKFVYVYSFYCIMITIVINSNFLYTKINMKIQKLRGNTKYINIILTLKVVTISPMAA